jgi:SSS family solute:Na+ symporter
MLDLIIVLLYLFCLVFIGLYSSKVKSYDQYGAGGKQYSAIIIFCTLTSSYVGGGFTIGLSEKTFSYGILYILAMFGFSLKEILIAKYLAPKMAYFQKNCATTGDIMELSYGRIGRLLTGFASIIVCGGIIGAQFAACGNILHTFFELKFSHGVILTAIVIVSYVSFGGLKSVIRVNVMNFIILFIMIFLICFFSLYKLGGVSQFLTLPPKSYFSPTGNLGYLALFILFVSFFFGETLVPPYTQRLLIGTSTTETKKGTLYSGLVSILIFSAVGLIGMVSYVLKPSLEPNLAFPYAVSEVLPNGLRGLGVVAMLAIIISSADAFLNAISIAIKKDIIEPIFGEKNTDLKHKLRSSRIITIITALIATIFALSTESVIDILLYSYQFWTPFILVPLVAAIYQIRTSKETFLISSIAGIGTVILWNSFSTYSSPVKGSLEGVVLGIIVNFIVFVMLRFTKLNRAQK